MEKQGKKSLPERGEGCPRFYTIAEVAKIARVSRRSIERMVSKRILSSTKFQHKRLIPQSEVHGILKENWVPAMPPE